MANAESTLIVTYDDHEVDPLKLEEALEGALDSLPMGTKSKLTYRFILKLRGIVQR